MAVLLILLRVCYGDDEDIDVVRIRRWCKTATDEDWNFLSAVLAALNFPASHSGHFRAVWDDRGWRKCGGGWGRKLLCCYPPNIYNLHRNPRSWTGSTMIPPAQIHPDWPSIDQRSIEWRSWSIQYRVHVVKLHNIWLVTHSESNNRLIVSYRDLVQTSHSINIVNWSTMIFQRKEHNLNNFTYVIIVHHDLRRGGRLISAYWALVDV